MRHASAILILIAVATSALAQSAENAVQLLPSAIKFLPLPFAKGVDAAWLVGAPDGRGPYTVRVHMAPDAKMPPHTHPDTRMVTVLSGELYAALGSKFDADSGKLYPAGAFFTVPAGVAHYVWARNGEVLYQESGTGPSPTALVNQ